MNENNDQSVQKERASEEKIYIKRQLIKDSGRATIPDELLNSMAEYVFTERKYPGYGNYSGWHNPLDKGYSYKFDIKECASQKHADEMVIQYKSQSSWNYYYPSIMEYQQKYYVLIIIKYPLDPWGV